MIKQPKKKKDVGTGWLRRNDLMKKLTRISEEQYERQMEFSFAGTMDPQNKSHLGLAIKARDVLLNKAIVLEVRFPVKGNFKSSFFKGFRDSLEMNKKLIRGRYFLLVSDRYYHIVSGKQLVNEDRLSMSTTAGNRNKVNVDFGTYAPDTPIDPDPKAFSIVEHKPLIQALIDIIAEL